jgi:hypothetical protein
MLPVSPTGLDALWRSFRKLVRAELPNLTFYGIYEYSVFFVFGGGVTARRTDSTLPVPDVVQIPIRTGIPGASVTPTKDAKIYVMFANGDPSKPLIHSYDSTFADNVTFDEGTGTAEHILTTEALCNVLLQVAPLIGPGINTLNEVVLDAAIVACGTTSNITALTIAAIETAMAAKVLAGGDGTPPGSKPGVGCPNLRGG